MKLKHAKKNSGFTLVELLVVIAIIAGLAAISSPIIIRQIAKSRATTAISNSKDIYVGVRDYAFKNGGVAPVGATSTDAFQILQATGTIRDEKPFFVTTSDAAKSVGNEDGTLTANENVFSYFQVAAGARGTGIGVNITNDSANTPLISCPVQTAGTALASTYSFGDFGGQAVILTSDGAVLAYPLTEGAVAGQGTIIDPATGIAYVAADVPFTGTATGAAGAQVDVNTLVCTQPGAAAAAGP